MIKIIIPKKLWKNLAVYALVMSAIMTITNYCHYPIYISGTVLLKPYDFDIIIFFVTYLLIANVMNYFNVWKE